ncbi:hypothetical protein E9529_05415 [Blastococcus sp. KM273128]|uniref:ATP-binding protein n=1 Tax=Blastococcus sp. KM273128 TaxID=2570314 RepID=UPI001F39357B|nr:SbcC/MukB-like Walker B domain-containing protein [Blastococcus sp. KM273128]MCF6743722.1 hypothetical protein [Blastococcus sp. KM273128]
MTTAPPRPPVDLAPDAAPLPLDFAGTTGVRLAEFQLFNWGTFDGPVQKLTLEGANALLTGQVGAGKSTIVDGLTTLFAAPSKVVFNRAAGADRSERTVNTYVLGHYRNVFDEATGSSRPEALRKQKDAYSVLLARFTGLPSGGGVLSAGVAFWFEATGTVHRMYFTAPLALDIAEHLAEHADGKAVRAALRGLGADVFDDNFKNYRRSLCRQLGVGPGALDLLVQTVSMKSVGDLTAFVRAHMLDPVDARSKIAAILEHWGDLTRAYELVVTARQQLEKLEPVAEHAAAYDRADARIAATREAQAAVAALVERHRVDLLAAAIADLDSRLPELSARVTAVKAKHEAASEAVTQLAIAVQQSGGAELLRAEHQVQLAEAALAGARTAAAELRELAAAAGVAAPEGTADWARFSTAVTAARREQKDAAKAAGDQEYQALRALEDARAELKQMNAELEEAGRRESNVPLDDAQLRGRIAADLGLAPTALPFAAELIAVDPDAAEWEAAAERLVRPLALSLLVVEEHYPRVAAWVDEHHLGRRLVYYRVGDVAAAGNPPRPGTMAANLLIRPGTPFTPWLRAEIARRYDHACVAGPAELGRHTRAVTRAGQIKDNAKHEKDDRRHAGDRRFYVLGWDTAARRAALAAALPGQRNRVAELEQAADKATAVRSGENQRGYALEQIEKRFPDPAAVDVAGKHDGVQAARELHDTIARNPKLTELLEKKKQAEGQAKALLDEIGKAEQAVGDARGRRNRWAAQHATASTRLQELGAPQITPDASDALTAAVRAAGPEPTDIEECDAWGRRVTEALTAEQGRASSTRERSGRSLVAAMKDFAALWPQVVDEIGTDADARGDYITLQERLRTDDLPSYEADFREQLQTNAIHELVTFSHFLDTESRKISGRIATINTALVDIDYRQGTYIRLENEPTVEEDIRRFRADLREVTANTLLADDEAYAEERFLKVKELLDRFKGREGSANADKTWTDKVTDVRNWHTFAASERTREEDAPVEHYTDSGGKSGGQKEKLAYTILAASLSYQYGLAGGHTNAFRFVMIDEAFGRGSDESTRFGLELFQRLDLQLLVVTPLQKIGTIEPFVQAVGYVRSEDPRSRLFTMPIAEYQATRTQWVQGRRAARTATTVTDPADEAPDPGSVLDGVEHGEAAPAEPDVEDIEAFDVPGGTS